MNIAPNSRPPVWLLRVLLVDNCQKYLSATARYLMLFPWIRVVGQAASASEALQLTDELSPDLVLLDIVMADGNGIDLIPLLKNRDNPPLVVMVSLHDDIEYRQHAREAGADGYVTKPELQTELPQLLDVFYANRGWLAAADLIPEWSPEQDDQKVDADSSENVQAPRRLRSAQLAIIFGNCPQAIMLVNNWGIIREINPAAQTMLGIGNATGPVGKRLAQLVSPEHQEPLQQWFKAVQNGNSHYTEFEILLADGQCCWIETHAIPVVCPDTDERLILCVSVDGSERKRTEDRLIYLTNYDALTGLPNRTLVADRLRQAMIEAKRHDRTICVAILDIDRFSNIADTQGHAVGDDLILAVATRLATVVRPGDTIARFGGDEFAILLHDMDKPGDAALIVQRIMDLFQQCFEIMGRDIYISASLGATLHPADCPDADVESLIGNAEIALFRAKSVGRSTCMFYDEAMTQRACEDIAIENALRHALDRNELTLYYQPIVDLRSGRINAFEALLRWWSPDLGTMSPVRFIPIAEESGLIIPIGKWVLRTACQQLRAWHDDGYTELHVAVNVSSRQFREPELAGCVQQILTDTGLEGRYLELELTESILFSSSSQVTRCITELNTTGIRFALDDFGTGYSSLAYLKRFPISKLKIDRSFIGNITTDTDDAAIVRAIITIADNLGIEVTAEGVEEPEQLAFLLDHGSHNMQGYLFSSPQPAESIRQMLVNGKHLALGYH